MALQLTVTDDATGAVYTNAYWRISGVIFPPGGNAAVVMVEPFVDQAAAVSKTPLPGMGRRLVMGPAGFGQVYPAQALVSEIIPRAYVWLKNRAEFVGATDA